MNTIEVCKSLRKIHNELRELANKIEREGILEIPVELMTLYGHSVKQIKEFIDFGREHGFSPKE